MIKIKTSAFLSPMGIFFIYILASGLVIMAFRFIFPGEEVPLAYFSGSWRLIKGLLDYLNLFPALALSSLVIPFGFIISPQDRNVPFSLKFFQTLKMPIITAIVASAVYGLIFSLVLPLAQDFETNLLSQGNLYNLALERAKENAEEGEWEEALQLVAICEKIWPLGPDHSRLKIEAEIRTEEERLAPLVNSGSLIDSQTGLPGNQPLNVTEALTMAEAALQEERYYDAHWLATLAGRLARPDSIEVTTAARLAGRAWSGVTSLAPNIRETQEYLTYRLKREGYEALIGEEWIRSYYIFLDLLAISPKDPDVAKYFALSEEGVKQAAFFIDEIELSLGKILTGAVFSLPYRTGRLVMRVSSLSTSQDTAYGIGAEILTFDNEGRLQWGLEAPYVKILPLALDSGNSLSIQLRALDRTDRTKRWESGITSFDQSSFGQSSFAENAPNQTGLVLPLSWDTFLLLSNVRRGLSGLSSADLRRAGENLPECGYLPQVFQAELLQRFAKPLFLLPFCIFAIALGWQYRAHKRPRYITIPMLGILPLVFNGAVQFSRSCLNDLGILAVSSLGFTTAAIVFGSGIVLLLILSLIYLASKRN